jgi:hypothetical protein
VTALSDLGVQACPDLQRLITLMKDSGLRQTRVEVFAMKNTQDRFSAISACRLPVRCLLAGSILFSSMQAQSPSQLKTTSAQTPPIPRSASHYEPNRFAARAMKYYGLVWGIDSLSVKAVESGELIRFTYRVLDPTKAAVFNDKKVEAFLISPTARVKLVIPSLEKVGQLRQINTPEAGKSYWMAFSNPHRAVKRGDRVNLEIGTFHAQGLVVD